MKTSSDSLIVSTRSNDNNNSTIFTVLLLQIVRIFIKSFGECMLKLHDGIEMIEKDLLNNRQQPNNNKELQDVQNDSYYDMSTTTNEKLLATSTPSAITTLDEDNKLVDQLMNNKKQKDIVVAVDSGQSSSEQREPPIDTIQPAVSATVPDSKPVVVSTDDDDKLHTSSISNDVSIDDPKIMMLNYPNISSSLDNINSLINVYVFVYDLWDDNVEPDICDVAKILKRDLWLSNAKENDICDLLERLIKLKTSRSDFVSYGGLKVLVIIMNKFKTNESIICKCCKLMAALVAKGDHDPIVSQISEDTRWIRCIVQCMNQYPNNIDIQRYCFCLLYVITLDKMIGANLVMEVFKKKNDNCHDTLSGLQSVLAGMKEFSNVDYMQSVGCHILQNIVCKEHRLMIRQHGAINVLKNALENHKITSAKSTIERLLSSD